jgi:hypothetical protein
MNYLESSCFALFDVELPTIIDSKLEPYRKREILHRDPDPIGSVLTETSFDDKKLLARSGRYF